METKDGASSPTCSTAEAAERLNTTGRKVRQMIVTGELVAEHKGGNYRIPVAAVEAKIVALRSEVPASDEVSDTDPLPVTRSFAEDVERVLGQPSWLLSIDETAAVVRKPVSLIRAAVHKGQLPTRMLGDRHFVPVPALEEWILTGEVR